jgi:hypothetical protein
MKLFTVIALALTSAQEVPTDTDATKLDGNLTEQENAQKDRYIYGMPGDEDYGIPRSADDIIRLEGMWELDFQVQRMRGFLEGYHRGMYQDIEHYISEQCMNKEDFTRPLYYFNKYMQHFTWGELTTIVGLIWNMWYNIDYMCDIEQYLYDLSMFCFDHDCSIGALMDNWMNKVFLVTGSFNALGSIYYDNEPDPNDHMSVFAFWAQIGVQVGKLVRYLISFDPKNVDYEAGMHSVDWSLRDEE